MRCEAKTIKAYEKLHLKMDNNVKQNNPQLVKDSIPFQLQGKI